MKRFFCNILFLVVMLAGFSPVAVAAGVEVLSEHDRKQMDAAIHFMDNGMLDEGIELLINLDKKYPENESIVFEICYGYIHKQDFETALKWGERMLKFKNPTADTYFMAGNVFDYAGHRDKAVKTYDAGLKKFPKSGRLLVEKGNIAFSEKNYDDAVHFYEESVTKNPEYAPAYFRLASIFSMTDERVWTIMYAQGFLLTRDDDPRRAAAARLIYDMYRDGIKLNGDSINVSFTKNLVLPKYAKSMCDFPYNHFFEQSLLKPLLPYLLNDSLTFADVMELRKQHIAVMDTTAHDYYDVPVMQLEREIYRAGHFDAYNMWLFQDGFPKEYDAWMQQEGNSEAMDRFENWYWEEKKHTWLHWRGVTRNHTTRTMDMPLPGVNLLGDAKGCREHRQEVWDAARWLLNAPCDTTSVLQKAAIASILAWGMGSDEVGIEVGECPLFNSPRLLPCYIAACVDYCLEHKKKEVKRDDFANVMMQVVKYARNNPETIDVEDKAKMAAIKELVDMNDEQLPGVFNAMYDKWKKDREQDNK